MQEHNATIDRPLRLKRLKMRASRRGMKEMDIILGKYVEANLDDFHDDDLDTLEAFMNRNDQILFAWISGASAAPDDATDNEKNLVLRLSRA